MRCPICKAETVRAYRPFCSKRCADVDLARWLGGGYALPGADPEDEDDLAEIEEALDALARGEDKPH